MKNALSDSPSLYTAGKGVQQAIEGGELSLSKPSAPSGQWGWLDSLGGAASNLAGKAANLYLDRAIAPAPETGPQYATDQSYSEADASALQTGRLFGLNTSDPMTLAALAAGAVGIFLLLRK